MIIKHNPKKLNKVAPIKEQPIFEIPAEEESQVDPTSTERVEDIQIIYSEKENKYKIISVNNKEEEI